MSAALLGFLEFAIQFSAVFIKTNVEKLATVIVSKRSLMICFCFFFAVVDGDEYKPNVSESSSSEDEVAGEDAIEIEENSEFHIDEDASDDDGDAKQKVRTHCLLPCESFPVKSHHLRFFFVACILSQKRTQKISQKKKSAAEKGPPFIKRPTQKGTPKSARKPASSSAAKSSFYEMNAADDCGENNEPNATGDSGTHEHNSLKFIKSEHIRLVTLSAGTVFWFIVSHFVGKEGFIFVFTVINNADVQIILITIRQLCTLTKHF